MSFSPKKVSIVIVVKNAVGTIEAAIKSIITQTYPNFELVILDGISTDGTLEIIKKYSSKIAYFSFESDSGIYDAMNKSIKRCTGDWVYFLGADDELMDNEVLSKIFNVPHKDNEIIYGNTYYIHRKTVRFGKMNRYKLSKHNFNHQTMFYPISVFRTFHYQTKYKILADYLMNILLYYKSNYQFKYVNVIVSRFNDLGTSGVNTIDFAFEEDRSKLTKEIFPNDVYIFYKARRAFLCIQKLFK